jgi:hypothetical protein
LRKSGLTLSPVILDAREQRFTARLANASSSKLTELHHNCSSDAPMWKVIREQHEHGQKTEGTDRLPPSEKSVARTSILDDITTAKSAVQHWVRQEEAKVGAGVWMWWTDKSHSDDGPVGAATVYKPEINGVTPQLSGHWTYGHL